MNIKIKRLSNLEINRENVLNWPIWKCDISSFNWEYPNEESCLILTGEVVVTTPIETVKIVAGDFIIFPKGLKCHWKVLQPIKKHYAFT